jgi:hypothetical protein
VAAPAGPCMHATGTSITRAVVMDVDPAGTTLEEGISRFRSYLLI